MTHTAEPTRGIEKHSIDHIPESERHGRVWHLGPMWFAANANLTILATGVFGLTLGANLFWCIVSVLLGVTVGTFFMAFHSAQGPQLGIPQLVQSRAQFGYKGALVVVPGVILMYVGYNVVNVQFTGQAAATVLDRAGLPAVPSAVLYVAAAAVVAVVAVFGYAWIHAIQRVLTVLFLGGFGLLTVGVLATASLPGGALDPGTGFVFKAFLAQFGIAAASQLGWAPYVADYSRYLPSRVGVRATFWWTYLGSALSAIWLMCLGALVLSAATGASGDPVTAIGAAADEVVPGLGTVILAISLPGLLAVTAVNTYCCGLTLITVADTVRRFRPQTWHRIAAVLLVAAVSCYGAVIGSADFLTNFYNIIVIMLYSFVPWTAINLIDFYVVRRGHYDVAQVFEPDGVYGRWNWRGLGAYAIAFVAMVPFWSIAWYVGPVAERLGGADISMLVGLPVAAALYLLFTAGTRERTGRPAGRVSTAPAPSASQLTG